MGMISIIKHAPRAAVRLVGKTAFKLKKVQPQILVGGGIVIAVGAFVLAIVNARKLDSTLAINESRLDEAEQKKKDIANAANLSDEEKKKQLKDAEKELNKIKAEGIWKIFCLIGVPTVAFAGGIAMTVGGHMILVRRFGQLSVAFASLKESFDRYRTMVIKEHGEEADIRYRYGIVDTIPGTEKVTDETGKEKTVKTLMPVVDQNAAGSLYTFEFSQRTSRKCPRDPLNMIAFARSQEACWNRWMESWGKPVTLAMVLEDLGIEWDSDDPKNDYILIAGWRPNGEGDNKIDYGIKRAVNKDTLELVNDVLILEFNCDGNLYHSSRYDRDGRKVC